MATTRPSSDAFKEWTVILHFFFEAPVFDYQLFLIMDDLSHITREVNKTGKE
jgi:hypothetical protein